MSLPYKVKSLDEVDETLKPHYKESDDGFVLDVAGSVSKTVLENEQKDRRTAESKLKEAQEAIKKFEGIDPENVSAMKKQIAELLDSKGKLSLDQLSPEELQSFRDEYMARITKEHQNEIERITKALETERDEYKGRLEKTKAHMVDSELEATVARLFAEKIRPEFLEDARLRAQRDLVWSEEDNAFYDADNNSVDVWAAAQLEDRKVWLLENKAGGARGGTGRTHNSGKVTTFSGATGIFD